MQLIREKCLQESRRQRPEEPSTHAISNRVLLNFYLCDALSHWKPVVGNIFLDRHCSGRFPFQFLIDYGKRWEFPFYSYSLYDFLKDLFLSVRSQRLSLKHWPLNQSNLPSWFMVGALFFYKIGTQQHTGILQAHPNWITRCWFLIPFGYNFKDIIKVMFAW